MNWLISCKRNIFSSSKAISRGVFDFKSKRSDNLKPKKLEERLKEKRKDKKRLVYAKLYEKEYTGERFPEGITMEKGRIISRILTELFNKHRLSRKIPEKEKKEFVAKSKIYSDFRLHHFRSTQNWKITAQNNQNQIYETLIMLPTYLAEEILYTDDLFAENDPVHNPKFPNIGGYLLDIEGDILNEDKPEKA